MKDFFELIARRESCRDFDPARPVEKDRLTAMLEAARLAPSACNSQPWKYYIVTDPALVQTLRPLLSIGGMNPFVKNCPCFAVVTELPSGIRSRPGSEASVQRFAPVDVGLSVAHFVLAAAEMGLGTCIIGALKQAKVMELLSIPETERIKVAVAVGYPATDSLRVKKRKPLEDTAVWFD